MRNNPFKVLYIGLGISLLLMLIGFLMSDVPHAQLSEAAARSARLVYFGARGLFILGFLGVLYTLYRFNKEFRNVSNKASESIQNAMVASTAIPQITPICDALKPMMRSYEKLAQNQREKVDEFRMMMSRYEQIFASIPDPVFMINTAAKIQLANKAAVQLFDLPSDLDTQVFSAYLRNSQIQTFIEGLLASNAPMEAKEVQYFVHPNTEPLTLILQGVALGMPYGALVAVNDVTRIRKMEKFQRQFVSNVSHELKTPLTVLISATENLQEDTETMSDSAAHFVEVLARNAHRMNAIIDDLLFLSRIENTLDTQSLAKENFRVEKLLKDAVQQCDTVIQKSHMHVQLDVAEGLMLNAVYSLVLQAVVNLLTNAVRYSAPETSILCSAQADEHHIYLRVKDHGMGIPSEHLSHIFTRFYRVDKSRSRQTGGTGLGLAIVKHICYVHGGRVSVQSKVGEGTEFELIFPR